MLLYRDFILTVQDPAAKYCQYGVQAKMFFLTTLLCGHCCIQQNPKSMHKSNSLCFLIISIKTYLPRVAEKSCYKIKLGVNKIFCGQHVGFLSSTLMNSPKRFYKGWEFVCDEIMCNTLFWKYVSTPSSFL